MLKNKAKEVNKVRETLSRINRGLYTALSIEWCSDRIYWLHKFGYLTDSELTELTGKATDIFNNGYYEEDKYEH